MKLGTALNAIRKNHHLETRKEKNIAKAEEKAKAKAAEEQAKLDAQAGDSAEFKSTKEETNK